MDGIIIDGEVKKEHSRRRKQGANARAAYQARQNQRNPRGRKFENKKAEAAAPEVEAPAADAAPVAEEAKADAE